MPEYDESFMEHCDRERKRKYRLAASSPVKKYWTLKARQRRDCPCLLAVGRISEPHRRSVTGVAYTSGDSSSGGGGGDSPSPSPLSGSGPGGHKASFRSTKLARRARSFKEDFLEKISQMRNTPGGGVAGIVPLGRPHSPRAAARNLSNAAPQHQENKSPTRDIELMVRQVQVALKHFRDVVTKDKLEMLPGNGTIVLDTVLSILSALKPLVGGSENSAALGSATHHVYQSLARLIKLCDDVLLNGRQSSALAQDNVAEVVTLLEDAVKDFVQVARDKLNHKSTAPMSNTSRSSCLELPAQRNSLPDIPLTPRERQTLEQKSVGGGSGTGSVPTVRSSHSTESVLRPDSPTPPPKPPLPTGVCLPETDSTSLGTPPPLPPKKRSQRAHQLIGECCTSDSSLLGCSFDRMSYRSRSPEDSSSLLSASAGSLDSVLNHSREEDEIRALMGHGHADDTQRENDISDITYIMNHGSNGNCSYEDAFNTTSALTGMNHISDLQPVLDINRLSNTDSGFASIHSHRNSVQSYSTSKRSSQQSSSSQWSSQQNSFKQLSANSVYSQHTETSVQNVASVQTTESVVSTCQTDVVESFAHVEKSVSSTTTATFSQHSSLSSSQMSDLSVVQSAVGDSSDVVDLCANEDSIPPAIPQKTRSRRGRHERQPSPYDNVPIDSMAGELIPCLMHQSQSNTITNLTDLEDAKPPPLPAKKRHIMAYMEMFGNCSHSNDNEFMRHSMHMVQTQWQNHQQQSLDSGLTSTQSCSFVHTSHVTHHTLTPPASVSLEHKLNQTSPSRSPNSVSPNSSSSLPPALPPKRSRASSTKSNVSPPPPPVSPTIPQHTEPNLEANHSEISGSKLSPKVNRDSSERNSPLSASTPTPAATHKLSSSEMSNKNSDNSEAPVENDLDLMDEIDVSKYIVLKKSDEDGPDIRGGYIDGLIVHATKSNKKDFSYQEAFLTTYRTFISPYDLITKLIRRHQYFICQPDRKPRAREAFSLLVRVVKDLTVSDLEDSLMQVIMDFIYQLVCSGNLVVAKLLRVTLIEKYNAKVLQSKLLNTQASLSLVAASATLLDFKSEQIAEQMTLLDADLFMKIEIPEVLIWAQEQNEERSPNLTRFTEHFNKMSYWARTKILQSEAKDREKYVMKFIKIMKHLRKINNFNSYLALLSALDSAPIRRLEWQKHITEGLKEYCALIDSSSSFRAYRQALAETSPPCIPYIGLVLQDLTFVHIGNSNLLPDGTINFSKRWQQFNIVENMKRFKKCTYTFKKNERIIAFFRNFDDFIGEDAMWQISESIKPRGGKKPA